MTRFTTAQLTRIGLFTALTTILSQLAIPMPYGVPMTMQTFIIPLVALLIGKKEGSLVAFTYLLLGVIGLPVFAGLTSGLGIILGPTGGFILSFPLLAYLSGIAFKKKDAFTQLVWLSIGTISNFLVGMLYFALVTSSSLITAFSVSVLPFIPTAILKIVLIFFVAKKLQPLMVKITKVSI